MMKALSSTMTALALLALTGTAAAATGAGKAPAAMTLQDIQSCMAKNLVDRGALRELSLTATDREGKAHSLRMKLYWKPRKDASRRINLRLVEPAAMMGSSYLLVQQGAQEEVFFYLPGAPQALRITGQSMSEPLWGTDFSYGEIKQVLGLLVQGDTQRTADARIAGRPVYVLATRIAGNEVGGYQKVASYVDQASCVLLKSEFFAKGEAPRKVLEADLSKLLQADTYWLMLGYTMRNVQDGTRTVVDLSDFSLMERMPERLFDAKTFYQLYE